MKQQTRYKCYWVDHHGTKKDEGTFAVLKENEKSFTFLMVRVGRSCKYPEVKKRVLPKEFCTVSTDFSTNVQHWGNMIQAHHGDCGYPFIYEPLKR